MKLKTKIPKKQYYKYKAYFYTYVVFMICISIYVDYQRWVNPLGMKPEADPKQHNGAQEFNTPSQFESSITHSDGRPITPYSVIKDFDYGIDLSDEDKAVFDELNNMVPLTDEEFQEKS